ncbi:unnamed protein product [Rodentolepis nana]|uniref:Uncharacterized protein n=1 Tax=Rodentolepis nana TaxID=102285 RepID=A0A0R3TL57_RODNA|nr:unnamed protein product [Rodentolepis nana]
MGFEIFNRILRLWRLSFLFAIILTLLENLFYLISFACSYWIVSIKNENAGFVRLGLWEVCFNNFIFADDYISKAYNGCWYVFRQEFKYIRYWINPPWFIIVQVLSIVCIILNLGSLLLILQNAAGIETKFCKLSNTPIIFLQSVVVACLTSITITMSLMSKDRMWLPFSDRNRVGWGVGLASTAGILTCLSIICLFVDQMAHYSEQIYRKLLEERGVLAVQSLPPDLTSGYDNFPPPTIPTAGAPLQSNLDGVPSLFMTGSLPSVVDSRDGDGGPAAKLQSILGGAKSARLSKYGEMRSAIPGMPVQAEKATTSGALASAKLRENLKQGRIVEQPHPPLPTTSMQSLGRPTTSGSVHSLTLSGLSGQQEKQVIVYGTSQGNILKDSAV